MEIKIIRNQPLVTTQPGETSEWGWGDLSSSLPTSPGSGGREGPTQEGPTLDHPSFWQALPPYPLSPRILFLWGNAHVHSLEIEPDCRLGTIKRVLYPLIYYYKVF